MVSVSITTRCIDAPIGNIRVPWLIKRIFNIYNCFGDEAMTNRSLSNSCFKVK